MSKAKSDSIPLSGQWQYSFKSLKLIISKRLSRMRVNPDPTFKQIKSLLSYV